MSLDVASVRCGQLAEGVRNSQLAGKIFIIVLVAYILVRRNDKEGGFQECRCNVRAQRTGCVCACSRAYAGLAIL